jgi:hypothetical protein
MSEKDAGLLSFFAIAMGGTSQGLTGARGPPRDSDTQLGTVPGAQ